VEVPDINF